LSETLKQGASVTGRLELDCVNVDARFQGDACYMTLLLENGQVTAQGGGLKRKLAGVAPTATAAGDESAITGGTRAYRGASGTVVTKSTRSGDTITVTFAP
jgi:hypothetical protein